MKMKWKLMRISSLVLMIQEGKLKLLSPRMKNGRRNVKNRRREWRGRGEAAGTVRNKGKGSWE